jgi:putative ABC transport system permease protein
MSFLNEVRYGMRVLLKSPSFTAIAALTLAVCIAANAAIFSMADAAFRPYPFRELDRLMAVSETIPRVSAERYDVSAGNFFDWKSRAHVLEPMEAYKTWSATLTGRDEAEQVQGYLVSPGFFSLLGVAPLKGRVFSRTENESERNEVVVSYRFWEQRLAADPGVIGRTVSVNGLGYVIVGVMPKEFEFPLYAELWAVWMATPAERNERVKRELGVVARLTPGSSISQAQAEMNQVAERLARDYPLSNAGRGIGVRRLSEGADPYARRFMAVLLGAVSFLLLLACANIANLQLARGAARRKEMAVRVAMGGSRARIARQMLTEGFLLSFLGAGLSLPLASAALGIIKASIPQVVARNAPYLMHLHLNGRMLAFVLVVVVLTTIASTLPVALQASPERLAETLKESGRGSLGVGRSRARSALVVSELAFAIVLLVGAGLMVNGFRHLASAKSGVDATHVLTFHVSLPETEYAGAAVANFYKEALRRLNAIPEIQSAAVISELPALGDSRSSPVVIEGQAVDGRERPLLAEVRVTSGEYFRTLGIPVREGRVFTSYDTAENLPVAVVSAGAAARFWPGQDLIGRRLRLNSAEMPGGWLTVVGVVGDVNHFFLDTEVRPTIYISYLQRPVRGLNFVLRGDAPFEVAAPEIRQAVRSVDGKQRAYDLQELKRFFTELSAAVGIMTSLMSAFALIALALSAAGVYALMACSVAQRQQEIGIRMALGAEPRDVLKLVVGNAVKLATIGLGIALPAALALSRAMVAAMSGIIALDFLALAGFAALPAAMALFAAYLPARRASMIDPLRALRQE